MKKIVVIFLLLIFAFLPCTLTARALGYEADATTFIFSYNNKEYIYRAKDFQPNAGYYDELNRLEQNGRTALKLDKLKNIDKMIGIGISKSVAFDYMYLGLQDKVQTLKQLVAKEKRDATFRFVPREKEPFEIVKEQVGVSLDIYSLYEQIYQQYQKQNTIKVMLPLIFDVPEMTAEKIKNLTAYRGGFSTSVSSSSNDRRHNVIQALKNFNGKVVAPGEEISFNKVVGVRNESTGYRVAKIIKDGEFVDGYGGGVCQASTTLYNAVVLADLPVTAVQKHSRRVSYVPPALDAMVNWGSSDMRFKNNTDSPIYITSQCANSIVAVKVYGQSLGKGIYTKTVSEIVKTTPPPPEEKIIDTNSKYSHYVTYTDESHIIKPSKDGIEAKSYLVKYKDGKEIARKFLRHEKYPSERGKVVRGAKERPVVEEPLTFGDYLERIFNW